MNLLQKMLKFVRLEAFNRKTGKITKETKIRN